MSKAAMALAIVLALSTAALAQGGGPQRWQNGQGNQGGRGGGGDFASINMQLLQVQLGVSDDEWEALLPKVQRVVDDQVQLQAGRARVFPSAGGDTRIGSLITTPDSPVSVALADLQSTLRDPNATVDDVQLKERALRDATLKMNMAVSGPSGPVTDAMSDLVATLNDPDSTNDELDAKTKALREARDKVKQDLAGAQADLVSLLTTRQETMLIAMGLLD